MTNILDDVPEGEPVILVAGTTWTWTRSDLGADYPNDTWTLTYAVKAHGTGAAFTITASNSGTDYLVEVASAITAGKSAGQYDWAAFVSSAAGRVRVGAGRFRIEVDLVAATADQRSHAEKMLAAIESVLEGRATKDVEAYTIEGRSVTRMKVDELLRFRDRYKTEVYAERRAALGQSARRRTLVSFS